jgi:hypothetical protein
VTTLSPPVVYDPYSAAFQADPWPVYRHLRDTAPVYVSERWGFYALSRLDDVRATRPSCRSSASTSTTRPRT